MLSRPHITIAMACILLAACHTAADLGASSGRLCSGGVIGSDVSFIRRGFCPGSTLEIAFAPNIPAAWNCPPISGLFDAVISTHDGTARPAESQAFHCAPLRVVAPLEHDSLSSFTFPGGNRVQSTIYSVSRTDLPNECSDAPAMCSSVPTSCFQSSPGQDAFAFVSLMEDGIVEVRLLSGNGTDSDESGCGDISRPISPHLFGVFSLTCE
ncbi:MAG: hypothetical protein IPK60_17185 [Sandaracinaceae bacterium]|nr:hypothetical protein [Sandaracinaceae bacterium]